MAQTEFILTIDDKAKVFEFHKLFKVDPKSITEEARKWMMPVNNIAWEIAKNNSKTIDERNFAYDVIEKIHEMLGRKFDASWRPKEGKKGGGNWKPLTKEQRAQNCKDFIEFMKSLGVAVYPEHPEGLQALAMIWGPTK